MLAMLTEAELTSAPPAAVAPATTPAGGARRHDKAKAKARQAAK
jgi:hypothetical protein